MSALGLTAFGNFTPLEFDNLFVRDRRNTTHCDLQANGDLGKGYSFVFQFNKDKMALTLFGPYIPKDPRSTGQNRRISECSARYELQSGEVKAYFTCTTPARPDVVWPAIEIMQAIAAKLNVQLKFPVQGIPS